MKTVNGAGSGDHGAKGPLHTPWCGGKLVRPICKLVCTSQKIKIPLSHDQVFPDQGMHPKDSKPINHRDTAICVCHGPIQRSQAVESASMLFTDNWRQKSYTSQQDFPREKNEIITFSRKCMKLEVIVLCEISYIFKKSHFLSFMHPRFL